MSSARELKLVIPPGKTKERIDVYLTNHIENATRTKVQDAISAGFVLVNGKSVRASHKVAPGETIEITIPGTPAPDVVAENLPLDILFEDNVPAGRLLLRIRNTTAGAIVLSGAFVDISF